MRPLRAVPVPSANHLLSRHPSLFGTTAGARSRALAEALASSPPWERLGARGVLVVRDGPSPVIAAVGRFEDSDGPLLSALGWQVEDSLRRLRPVGYSEAERACVALADRLRAALTPDELAAARFVAVPRGGLLVTGLLSYCLGLAARQLATGPGAGTADGPVVVVDDCVLSGARTRRWLDQHDGPPVVLAHLHSHPDLRRSLAADPRVRIVVAAADLVDHAPRRHGAAYEQWRQDWACRSPDDYWTGHPDHVSYPWNEPDTVVWDARAARAEAGWHVVPPSWCVKNRATAGEVQVCEVGRAADRLPPGVLWVELDGDTVVIDVGTGAAVELRGTSGELWHALLRTAEPGAAARALAERYAVALGDVERDAAAFVDQMSARGLWWPPTRPERVGG